MAAPIKNTVGAAVSNGCFFRCTVEWGEGRRWVRWRCSCGEVGLWDRVRASAIIGSKFDSEPRSWWDHVLTWHGIEYE